VADQEVLQPGVPADQRLKRFEAVRQMTNPSPATPDILEKGKTFEDECFCRVCHGADGKELDEPRRRP
jgi:hypothetical protein